MLHEKRTLLRNILEVKKYKKRCGRNICGKNVEKLCEEKKYKKVTQYSKHLFSFSGCLVSFVLFKKRLSLFTSFFQFFR